MRTVGGLGLVAAVAYATIFVVVGCSSSPTDRTLALADGRTLAYSQWGDRGAARVILVHGAPADASSWNRLKSATRDTNGVEWIAVDRLGYGHSSPGAETSLEAQARALDPLIDDGAVLVGHSYGGPVVLRAAAEFPDRVKGIVLVAGACDAYMNDAQWFRSGVDAVSGVVPEPWAVGNLELLDLTGENRAMEPMLGRVTCPVVIVHGTWDPVCPYEGTVEYLSSRLVHARGIEVVTLSRTGHNIHLSRPGVIVEHALTLAGATGGDME